MSVRKTLNLMILSTPSLAIFSIFYFHFYKTSNYIFFALLFVLVLMNVAHYLLLARRETLFRDSKSLSKYNVEIQYRALADAVSEGVIIHDGKSVIDVNLALRNLFRYGDMAVGQLDLKSACSPKDLARVQQHIASGSEETYTVTFVRLDQSEFLGEVRVKKISFLGKIVRAVCIRDITEQKRAEEQLQSSHERINALAVAREKAALESSRLKSEFLANMSHEIRTPLNGIIGTAELLFEFPMSEEQKRYLDTLRNSGNNLFAIVNDILDFSKIEAGKLEFDSRPFDLKDLIGNQFDLFITRAAEKNTQFSLIVDPEISANVLGDSVRLGQILANLISNAIKFTENGSVVVEAKLLKMDQSKIDILFSVTDSGLGIEEETIAKLFSPFTQADSSTSKKFGGTGLGLSISKKLVEMMNGKIGVESKIGKGSKFWFSICFDKIEGKIPDDEKQAKIADVLSVREHRGGKILVAEDNKVNQLIISANLAKLGFSFKVVDNGKEALEHVALGGYDLILMDCQMPEMDGFTAAKIIRENERGTGTHIPIIALTANAMKEDEQKCLEAGMDGYLAKPYSRKSLSGLIDRLLLGTVAVPMPVPVKDSKSA